MYKNIKYFNQDISVFTDKNDKILFAKYNDNSTGDEYYCGRALLNSDGESNLVTGFSASPMAKELYDLCGIDTSIGNKFIITHRTKKNENEESVVSVIFEDVSKFEAAINQIARGNNMSENSWGFFANPEETESRALLPLSLVSYNKTPEKNGSNWFKPAESSSINVLDANQIDWDYTGLDCPAYLLSLVDEKVESIEQISKIDPDSINGYKDYLARLQEPIKFNMLCKPSTAKIYNMVSQGLEKQDTEKVM